MKNGLSGTTLLALILSLGASTACSFSRANKIGLGVVGATLVCDYGQTRWHAKRGWRGYQETNPILGTEPSVAKVTGYFLVTGLVVGAVYYILPFAYKTLYNVTITGFQAKAIYINTRQGTPLCGI